jgi:hypothetical protein
VNRNGSNLQQQQQQLAESLDAADRGQHVNGNSLQQQQQQQLVLAGSLQLLCPQPWQRQLVCLLAQEPSEHGLLLLLRQLPGIAVHQQQQQQQQAGSDAAMATDMQIAAAVAAAVIDGAGSAWSCQDLLTWPDLQEWGQPAAVQLTQSFIGSQGPTVQDNGQVSCQLLSPS